MSTADCREPGRLRPVIDRSACEGKEACARVCPYQVFQVRPIAAEDRARLGAVTRFKLWVHGGRQAYLAAPESCHGCGLCVSACPERAITLRAV